MTLPSELVSLAVRGTTQPSTQGYYQTADTTLRLCGIHSFQTLGGYIPLCDKKDLSTPHISSSIHFIPSQNLKHLRIILSEHPAMIEEWIQAICQMGQTVPDEYIPYFLELGCQRSYLQKWLKLIMSDKANWLLGQSNVQNWKWYQNCEMQSVDDVIAQQTKDNRTTLYQISVSLANDTLNPKNHRALNLLRDYAPMWTEQIAKIFIKAMFVSNVTASYDEKSLLTDIIRRAGYNLPLKFAVELLAELRSGVEQWHQMADEIEATFIMRQEILAAIRESE